jgi:hypothetical protein
MSPWAYFIVAFCGGFLVIMLGYDLITYRARMRKAQERLDRIIAKRKYDQTDFEGLWPWERDLNR